MYMYGDSEYMYRACVEDGVQCRSCYIPHIQMLHTMYNYIYALTMQHLIYIHIDQSGTYTYITLWEQHCMIHCTRMSEMTYYMYIRSMYMYAV